jgi:hypothetical protein
MNIDPTSRLRNERGVVLAFVAILLFAFIGMAALAIDLGMVYGARTEAQRSADAGALAGASVMLDQKANASAVRAVAGDWAGRNRVQGLAPILEDADIDVLMDSALVRVRVHRSEVQGANPPVRNLFARALGLATSNVSAVAAAQVMAASTANCVLPMALVDRWWKPTGARFASQYEKDVFITGTDFYREGAAVLPYTTGSSTGFGIGDRGMRIRITADAGGSGVQPGWANQLDLKKKGGGGAEYRDAIGRCVEDDDFRLSKNDPIEVFPGLATGPTRQGFSDLINSDPNAQWGWAPNGPPEGCVVRPGTVNESGQPICVQSPRTRGVVLISPVDALNLTGASKTVPVTNVMGVFVECLGSKSGCPGDPGFTPDGGQNNEVWVRLIDYRGLNAVPVHQDPGSLLRTVVLVE